MTIQIVRKNLGLCIAVLAALPPAAILAAPPEFGDKGFASQLRGVAEAFRAQANESDSVYHLVDDGHNTSCRNSKGEEGHNKFSREEFMRDKQGECASLYGVDLHGADLRGANLAGASILQCDLHGANLSDANLRGAIISLTNLNWAILNKADMMFVSLKYDDFGGASLQWVQIALLADHVKFNQANFRGANLRGSVFGGANLSGANFRGSYLGSVDFKGANLRDADLRGAWLGQTEFGDALLSGADFRGAWYTEKTALPFDAKEALNRGLLKWETRGVSGYHFPLVIEDGKWPHCRTDDRDNYNRSVKIEDFLKNKDGECVMFWDGSTSPSLPRTDLSSANLIAAFMTKGDLSGANLQRADMTGSRLTDSILIGASMTNSRIVYADLSGAQLMSADLRGALINFSNLKGTDLRGARLNGTTLIGTSLDGADMDQARYDDDTILPFDDDEASSRGMIKE